MTGAYIGGVYMTLYESLLMNFGYNEPIFVTEILFKDYSRPWIYKELNKLCAEKKLIRFDKGIYYIPKETIFGKTLLNPEKVIEKKYIRSDSEIFGFYSGQTLLNQFGMSTQMPNIIEICTNNESSKIRDVDIAHVKVRLRRSKIDVTKENEAVLRFLELMNYVIPGNMDQFQKSALKRYVNENKITREDITRYAPVFPDKVMRNLIESEVIYSVTQ